MKLFYADADTQLQADIDHHRTLHDFISSLNRFLHNELIQVALTIAAIIVVQLIVRDLVARIIRRAVRRHRYDSEAELQKRTRTVTQVCQTAVGGIIWIIGIIMILGVLHFPIATLATGAGLVSVIIGLGAQNTIKDFMSGIFIILENQYAVGDIVTVHAGGEVVSGTVEDLTIRITKLRDLDGVLHIVTNGTALVISNNTARYSKVKLTVPINYKADVEKVEQVINQVGQEMMEDEAWRAEIIEPICFWRINSFDKYAVSALVIGTVKSGAQYRVAGEFRARLLKAFKAHRIEVPLAQMVS